MLLAGPGGEVGPLTLASEEAKAGEGSRGAVAVDSAGGGGETEVISGTGVTSSAGSGAGAGASLEEVEAPESAVGGGLVASWASIVAGQASTCTNITDAINAFLENSISFCIASPFLYMNFFGLKIREPGSVTRLPLINTLFAATSY